MIKFLYLLVLTFLYIYGPVFNSIGSWADFIFVTSIVLIYSNLILKKVPILNYFLPFLILIPLFFYSILVSELTFNITFSDYIVLALKPVRILITLFGGYYLAYIIQKKYPQNFINEVFKLIYYSIGLHAIIMVAQFFSPEFKDYIYGYTTSGEFTSFEYNFRMGGLSGAAGGAILSLVQALGILLLPFFQVQSVGEKILRIIFSILILASVFTSGRSGLLIIVICFPLAFIATSKLEIQKLISRIAVLFLLVIGVFFTVYFLIQSLPVDDPVSLALSRTFDTYINFKESGTIKDETTSELFQYHILFPTELTIWFFGQPENLVNFGFYRTLNSDSGYIRDIWSFGIIGTFVYYFPIFWTFFKMLSANSKSIATIFLILFSIILIVFHFKEPFFYVRMLWSIYSLVLACHYLTKNNKCDNNESHLIA